MSTSLTELPKGIKGTIKLPRDTVRACGRACRRSRSFSCEPELEQKFVLIFCTGDRGKVTHVFLGIVKRVSKKARRPFVIVAQHSVRPDVLERTF